MTKWRYKEDLRHDSVSRGWQCTQKQDSNIKRREQNKAEY